MCVCIYIYIYLISPWRGGSAPHAAAAPTYRSIYYKHTNTLDT